MQHDVIVVQWRARTINNPKPTMEVNVAVAASGDTIPNIDKAPNVIPSIAIIEQAVIRLVFRDSSLARHGINEANKNKELATVKAIAAGSAALTDAPLKNIQEEIKEAIAARLEMRSKSVDESSRDGCSRRNIFFLGGWGN